MRVNYGYPDVDDIEREAANRYPFAKLPRNGGCLVSPANPSSVEIEYCIDCTRERRQWIQQRRAELARNNEIQHQESIALNRAHAQAHKELGSCFDFCHGQFPEARQDTLRMLARAADRMPTRETIPLGPEQRRLVAEVCGSGSFARLVTRRGDWNRAALAIKHAYDFEWAKQYKKHTEAAKTAFRSELEQRKHEEHAAAQRLQSNRRMSAWWAGLSWLEFEIQVAELFKTKGYEVVLTPQTNDEGIDVIAKQGKIILLIQCKHQKDPTGRPTVQQLAGAVSAKRGARGVFICSGGFTRGATKFAATIGIDLWDLDRLARESC